MKRWGCIASSPGVLVFMGKSAHLLSLAGDPRWCYLCGLKIPQDIIASPRHPLFGTVEHVIPKSRGGQNRQHNRMPAHYLCNRWKKNRLVEEIDLEDRYRMQTAVRVLLVQVCNMNINNAQLLQACKRAGLPPRGFFEKEKKAHFSYAHDRWEDDGGALRTG